MASFKTLENGRVRAFLCVNGQRRNKTFTNKQKAKSWVREIEYQLEQQENDGVKEIFTLGQLFRKYAREVSPSKKGERWEIIRLNHLETFKAFASIKLIELKREDIEGWINERLESVKSSSVNRELNLISHCLTQARRWHLMNHNPFKDLQRPKNPPARFRRISDHEIQQLDLVMAYRTDTPLQHQYQFVALAFRFAIETALRAGEICALTNAMINTQTRVIKIPAEITKNGHPRDVPLSTHAIELLKQLPEPENQHGPIFQLKSSSLDVLFRKYRDKTTIQDLHFHDTRHEAITRLAAKLDVLDLARVVGHRDIKQLMVYYNKTAEELAQQLG